MHTKWVQPYNDSESPYLPLVGLVGISLLSRSLHLEVLLYEVEKRKFGPIDPIRLGEFGRIGSDSRWTTILKSTVSSGLDTRSHPLEENSNESYSLSIDLSS